MLWFSILNYQHLEIFNQKTLMWSLFAAVQPKSTKPTKSLKQVLLTQEIKSLKNIEEYASKLLNGVNDLLKKHATQQSTQTIHSLSSKLDEYECAFQSLYKKIVVDNELFKESAQQRDNQKQSQHEFFRNSMKSYQEKRKQLNDSIVQLQEKVQKLELQGHTTYQFNPKPHNILSGINKNYIQKYLSKIDDAKQIQKHFLKNKQNQSIAKKQQQQDIQTSNMLTQLIQNCKIDQIQTKLKQILLKQELKKDMIIQKANKNKKQFIKYAKQQKKLKESIKDINAEINFYQMQNKISQGSHMEKSEYVQYLRLLNKKVQNFRSYHPKEVFWQQNEARIIKHKSFSHLKQYQDRSQSNLNQVEQTNFKIDDSFQQEFVGGCEFLITDRFLQEKEEAQ